MYKGRKIMKHFYTILFWEKGKWRNECVLYPTKKEAEQRRRFFLQNFMQECEGGWRFYDETEVLIFKVKEVQS